MTFIVDFSRTEAHHNGEASMQIEVEDFVQMTYTELRRGPNGDELGRYIPERSEWWYCRPGHNPNGREWFGPFSDVTITQKGEAA